MHLTRLLTTATAAALIACPVIAAAAGDAPAAAPAAAAPAAPAAATPAAPPAAALPSIPKIASGPDIYSTLKASGQFTILLQGADQTGIAPYLQKYPNFTLFAPTDDAFKALPPDVLAKLLAKDDASANQLQRILAYHLLTVQLDSSKIKGAKGPVPTAEKQPLQLDGSNPGDLLVNNADIIQADVRTTNGGIIHAIDKVLIPADSPYAATLKPASTATPSASAAPAATLASGG
jgi:uncharacterized surface protein with fasciclin (FAS1) repeats